MTPDCDHKFIDSTHCLKCGWTPDTPKPPLDAHTLSEVHRALANAATLAEDSSGWIELRSPEDTLERFQGWLHGALEVKPPAPSPASAETLRCGGCGKPYSFFPLDTTLPDEQWMAIQGRPGGVLCANCIVERAAKLPGAVAVRARIAFGSEPQELASAETLELSTYTPAMWVSLTTSDEQWAEYVRVRQIAADAIRRLQSTEQERFNEDHWFAEAQKQAQRAEAAEQKLREQEKGTR